MSVIVMKLENLSEYFSREVAFQNAPKLILSSESCLLPWKQKKNGYYQAPNNYTEILINK